MRGAPYRVVGEYMIRPSGDLGRDRRPRRPHGSLQGLGRRRRHPAAAPAGHGARRRRGRPAVVHPLRRPLRRRGGAHGLRGRTVATTTASPSSSATPSSARGQDVSLTSPRGRREGFRILDASFASPREGLTSRGAAGARLPAAGDERGLGERGGRACGVGRDRVQADRARDAGARCPPRRARAPASSRHRVDPPDAASRLDRLARGDHRHVLGDVLGIEHAAAVVAGDDVDRGPGDRR